MVLSSCSAGHEPARLNGTDLFTRTGYKETSAHVFSVRSSDAAGAFVRKDTIALFCSGHILRQQEGQYAMQWQLLTKASGNYRIIDSLSDHSVTGIAITDSLIYIHPPRHRHLQVLQFAPHPLLRISDDRTRSYNWPLGIGKLWSLPPAFRIDSVDTFDFIYQVAPSSSAAPCTTVIAAVCGSRFGESTARFRFDSEKGLVRLEYRILGQQLIVLELIDRLDSECARMINPLFYDEAYRRKPVKGPFLGFRTGQRRKNL